MKIALVHDFIKEYGGAERVLRELANMYPSAPIYTAFRVKGSTCDKEFSDKKIIESKLAFILKTWKLYSPLRFLIPVIWKSMDLSDFDLVITSASSYIARGFKVGGSTKVICYCHTPPRYLYGYQTAINWQKYRLVRIYAAFVNHLLRLFDFQSAQKVDLFIANSENVKQRIEKHYRKKAIVIHPPIEVEKIKKISKDIKKKNYFFIAARLVGGKGIEDAAEVLSKMKIDLKIAGEEAGFSQITKKLDLANIELLGRISDRELYKRYAEAKGFIAMERDVDFGMTPLESMAAGTAVIALNSGGYKETVMDGKTGILISDTKPETLKKALKRFESIKWNREALQKHAEKFSVNQFRMKFKKVVQSL